MHMSSYDDPIGPLVSVIDNKTIKIGTWTCTMDSIINLIKQGALALLAILLATLQFITNINE